MNWLTAQRVRSLSDVTQDHCDRYLTVRRLRKDSSGTVTGTLDESVVRVAAAVMIELASYADLLSADRYRGGFTPWNGRSSSKVAGMRAPAENKTTPVSQDVLQPLLAAALYITGTITPHLLQLPPQVRQRQQDRGWQSGSADHNLIEQVLRRHIDERRPLEATGDDVVAARSSRGWNPDDPLRALTSPRCPLRRAPGNSATSISPQSSR